jgi:pilus assembly protein Flp/PilA
MEWSSSFLRDEQGQDVFEYALLVSLIAIIVIAVLTILGADISDFYQEVADTLPG